MARHRRTFRFARLCADRRWQSRAALSAAAAAAATSVRFSFFLEGAEAALAGLAFGLAGLTMLAAALTSDFCAWRSSRRSSPGADITATDMTPPAEGRGAAGSERRARPDDAGISCDTDEPPASAPEETAPDETMREDAAPEVTEPEDTVAEETMPEDAAADDSAPKEEASKEVSDKASRRDAARQTGQCGTKRKSMTDCDQDLWPRYVIYDDTIYADPAEGGPKDHAEDDPDEHAEEGPERPVEDGPQGHAENNPERHAEGAPKDRAEDDPDEHAEERPERLFEDGPQGHAENNTERHAEGDPKDRAEDNPDERAEEGPECPVKDGPQGHAKGKPDGQSEDGPKRRTGQRGTGRKSMTDCDQDLWPRYVIYDDTIYADPAECDDVAQDDLTGHAEDGPQSPSEDDRKNHAEIDPARHAGKGPKRRAEDESEGGIVDPRRSGGAVPHPRSSITKSSRRGAAATRAASATIAVIATLALAGAAKPLLAHGGAAAIAGLALGLAAATLMLAALRPDGADTRNSAERFDNLAAYAKARWLGRSRSAFEAQNAALKRGDPPDSRPIRSAGPAKSPN